LSILLTDDKEIHRLNKDYRGKDKATDVLSFPLEEGGLLGDVVISLPTAKRQAKEYGVSFQAEFFRLLVHGTLHLLGFEHERVSKAKAEKMRRTEERLFRSLFALRSSG